MNVVVFFILVYFLAFYKVIFCKIALFYVQKQKNSNKKGKEGLNGLFKKDDKKTVSSFNSIGIKVDYLLVKNAKRKAYQ